MPGVNVTTAVRSGPVGTNNFLVSQAFMVGETERGPVDEPVLLRSTSDYVSTFGGYASDNLYAHVRLFFDEGGTRCYVRRLVGAAASPGSAVLVDGGDPAAATLTVSATSPGSWSDSLKVSVLDANVGSGFRLQLLYEDVVVYTSPDFASKEECISGIASSSVSHLIEISDASPLSSTLPVSTITPVQVSPGNEDAPAASDYVTFLGADDGFSSALGAGVIMAPGKDATNDATIVDALREHGVANSRVVFVVADDSAGTVSSVKSAASGMYGDAGASHVALFWPHLKVNAPNVLEVAADATAPVGTTITISPEGYAAGARARAIQAAQGPWRPGAGQISIARSVVGLSHDISPSTGDSLDAARVNAIRVIADSFRIYGARSVSQDEVQWKYITQQDTVNYIKANVERRMEQFMFSTIDGNGRLFGSIRASLTAFLDTVRLAGGLFEAYTDNNQLLDPGYSVKVDSDINPLTQLATGMVKAEVGIRVSGVADLINITITKSNLTAPVI